jgi:hypothetical protein
MLASTVQISNTHRLHPRTPRHRPTPRPLRRDKPGRRGMNADRGSGTPGPPHTPKGRAGPGRRDTNHPGRPHHPGPHGPPPVRRHERRPGRPGNRRRPATGRRKPDGHTTPARTRHPAGTDTPAPGHAAPRNHDQKSQATGPHKRREARYRGTAVPSGPNSVPNQTGQAPGAGLLRDEPKILAESPRCSTRERRHARDRGVNRTALRVGRVPPQRVAGRARGSLERR